MKVYKSATGLCLSIVLMACGQSQDPSKLQAIVPTDPQSTLDLGRGFNTLSSAAKGDCVVRTEPENVFASNGKSIRMSIDKIESSQDLTKSLDFSAEANYGNMVSGKASFAKSLKINEYSVYVLGKVNIQLMTQTLRDVKLKDDTFELAGQSFPRFLERCGNEFVIGRTMGGEMFVLLEIKTRSKDEKRKIEAQIQGSYGVASGSASFASNLENIVTNNSTSFRLYQDGGTYTDSDLTVPELIKRVKSFPDLVTPENAWPVSVTTASYTTLPMPIYDNPYDLLRRQEVLADYLKLQQTYEDFASTVRFMLDNPTQFIALDAAVWNQNLIQINTTLNTILRRESDCYNLTASCEFNTDIVYPDESKLPQRIEKFEVKGCMDSNAVNFVKNANVADSCHFKMNALVNFRGTSIGVIGKETSRVYNFETDSLTGIEAVNKCSAQYQNIVLRDHRAESAGSYQSYKTTCTFVKPLPVKPLPMQPFPPIVRAQL